MGVIIYKCPNCDGGLVFDPSSQKYHCEFRLSNFTQEELDQEYSQGSDHGREPEYSQDQEHNQNQEHSQAVLYNRPNCGAQIVTGETTVAAFCYYCHNPVVLSGWLSGEFVPDHVIPFQVDRDKAKEIFAQWIKKKKYAVDEFYSSKQVESMTRVYFPYWLYGCKVDGVLGVQGKKLRTWDTGNMRYTETQVYDTQRQGTMDVDNVARNGLRKANGQLIDGVLPFWMEKKKPSSMGYLPGFMAENRDMEKDQFVTDVKTEIKTFALQSLQSQAGFYNSLQTRRKDAQFREGEWSYVPFPVQILVYDDRVRGKIYYFALNGWTSKVCGQLPVGNRKLARLFLSISLPLCVLFLIGGYLL